LLQVDLKNEIFLLFACGNGLLQVLKKCGAFIDFKKELIRVNIPDPNAYFVENDVTLQVELYDQGSWQDDILGRGEMSLLPFMDTPGTTTLDSMKQTYEPHSLYHFYYYY